MSAQEDCTSPLTQAPLLTGDGSAAAPRTADWQPGLAVGPYRLERILGEGGMGRVWLAEQLQPLRRKVAIKVSLQSRPDPISEAFFEIERQAMAQLSHRAIAQIH
jgi:non-specific serine/threonine protein kinase/serine/threonine-protein kinase